MLTARAKALAMARAVEITDFDTLDSDRYLVTHCGSEKIAVCMSSVAQVYRPSGVTPLPRTTPPVWGLAAWRGRILTILSIGDCVPQSNAGLIAVLSQGAEVFAGMWVNEVEGETVITKDDIKPLGGISAGRETYLSGMTAEAVLMLSAGKLKAILERETPA